jgi:hypothetical protein
VRNPTQGGTGPAQVASSNSLRRMCPRLNIARLVLALAAIRARVCGARSVPARSACRACSLRFASSSRLPGSAAPAMAGRCLALSAPHQARQHAHARTASTQATSSRVSRACCVSAAMATAPCYTVWLPEHSKRCAFSGCDSQSRMLQRCARLHDTGCRPVGV